MKRSLLAELRRRNVLRAGAFYIALVWALAQGIAQLGPAAGLPDWTTRWFLVAAVVGFPFWIAFAWFYEFTPEGIKRESEVEPHESITHHTGRKLDFAIIAVMAVAIVLLVTDRFVLHHGVNEEAAIPVADHSIAVLPFVDMSSGKDQEYFSDGISEELLNLLAKIPELQVTARTSSFAFKGKETGIPEIARTLHVAHVLEGSVRKSGNSVRITAQLIRAGTGTHLWSETYDHTLDDIFKVQDEIAAAVVGQLKIKLLGDVPKAKPVDPKAYPLILQAQALLDQTSRAGREHAASAYQQALAIAPNEARAWAGLSRVYLNQVVFAERPAAEGVRLAKEAANKALSIDPGNVIALASLAGVASDFDFDLPAAARYLQRALELESGNLILLNAAANMLMYIGRNDEARGLLEYRAAHDPANPTAIVNVANSWYFARQWASAIDGYHSALRLSPALAGAHAGIALSLLLGKLDAAAALKEAEEEPDEPTRMAAVAMALHGLGRDKEADAALQALVDKFGPDQPEYVATAHAYGGLADAAFEWLDKADAIHDPGVASVLSDPVFDTLHGDPRWLPYLRKIGYAPEQLAKIEFKVTLPQADGNTASGLAHP